MTWGRYQGDGIKKCYFSKFNVLLQRNQWITEDFLCFPLWYPSFVVSKLWLFRNVKQDYTQHLTATLKLFWSLGKGVNSYWRTLVWIYLCNRTCSSKMTLLLAMGHFRLIPPCNLCNTLFLRELQQHNYRGPSQECFALFAVIWTQPLVYSVCIFTAGSRINNVGIMVPLPPT